MGTHSSILSTSFSPKMAKQSQIRQNYHEECEALVNKQVNMELYYSYVYLSMSAYFALDDIALPGFADFFAKTSAKEKNHGAALMKYQTMRGGRVVLQDITKPTTTEWGTPLEAVLTVLDLERKMVQSLLELQTKAMAKADFHLVDNDIARMVTYTTNKDVVRIVRNGDVMKTFITGENATATTTSNFQNLALDCVVA